MISYLPPALFVLAIVFGLLGVEPPGPWGDSGTDMELLLWIVYLCLGWNGVGGGIAHTVFSKPVAASIGWPPGYFQYEVGFANLGIGLGAIYSVHSGSGDALIAATIAASVFLLLAAVNHVRGMASEHNFAPGNSVILVSDVGAPLIAIAMLIATGLV